MYGKPDDKRFLGKEIEYYRLIYDILNACKNAKITGNDDMFISIVNHLEATFPYRDDKYREEIKKKRDELDSILNRSKDKIGRDDENKKRQAIIEFTNEKYYLIIDLLKRRKVVPQEAEEEWL